MDEKENRSQYRWDPFLREWIIYAPKRNKRPFQGKEFKKEEQPVKKTWTCPFCPDAPEGAGEWTVKLLGNKFAALSEEEFPFTPSPLGRFSQVAPNAGKNNVILYSQDHHASFGTLSDENIVEMIKLSSETYNKIGAEEEGLKYIFMMENRGKEIGCSMHHPHGQIYSFPFLPPKIERKFESFKNFASENEGKCLMCELVQDELKDGSRIIEKNEDFIAEIPFYAHWPYEVHIMAINHTPSIGEFSSLQIKNLAEIMKKIVNRYDKLWDPEGNLTMPYVMTMHNAPSNTPDRDKWHFHIEYYTPFRGKDQWKYLAGVELGTNLFLSDNLPHVNAKKMRDIEI